MEMKQWRNVIIYDKKENRFVDLGKYYLVNQYGEIYSKYKNILLKHNVIKKGYHSVRLYVDKVKIDKLVPNIVGWSFPEICGKYEPGLQTNHKDENKDNNCASNIEWCTGAYNVSYGTGMERRLATRIKNKCAKREIPVIQMKNGIIINVFKSMIDAERIGGFDGGCISRCCMGIFKQHKGFEWQYA